LHFRDQRAEIEERASTLGPTAAAQRVARLTELPELLARNANPQIALDHLLSALSDLR